ALPLEAYTERVSEAKRLVDAGKLLGRLHEGRSLLIQELEHHHPPVRAFAERLGRRIDAPIHVGVFCSWPGQRVLPPPHALHENFVTGPAGEKAWPLFGPLEPYPFEFDTAQACPEEVAFSTTIRRGDLLYIPRGCWHVARASGGAEPSMHLTISVRCRT